jgi:hypothetical protein
MTRDVGALSFADSLFTHLWDARIKEYVGTYFYKTAAWGQGPRYGILSSPLTESTLILSERACRFYSNTATSEGLVAHLPNVLYTL